MPAIQFSADEQKVLRYLADRFHSGTAVTNFRCVTDDVDLPADRISAALKRFDTFGYLDWDARNGVTMNATLLDAAQAADAPPTPRDYWSELTVWFKSRPWSLPVLVALVGIPLVIEWIEMLQTVLAWMTGQPKDN